MRCFGLAFLLLLVPEAASADVEEGNNAAVEAALKKRAEEVPAYTKEDLATRTTICAFRLQFSVMAGLKIMNYVCIKGTRLENYVKMAIQRQVPDEPEQWGIIYTRVLAEYEKRLKEVHTAEDVVQQQRLSGVFEFMGDDVHINGFIFGPPEYNLSDEQCVDRCRDNPKCYMVSLKRADGSCWTHTKNARLATQESVDFRTRKGGLDPHKAWKLLPATVKELAKKDKVKKVALEPEPIEQAKDDKQAPVAHEEL